MAEPTFVSMMSSLKGGVLEHVPHCRAIGMRLLELERGAAILTVPYDARLVGTPDTGVIHGGVITTLLDNASGIAVQSALDEMTSIATLDLRIDYMRPAAPGRDLIARAHCYKITRNVAFVRGAAYHERDPEGNGPDDPIATTVATFMLSANAGRPPVPEAAQGI